MTTTTLRKHGGSLAVTLPKPMADALGLAPGASLTVTADGNRLTLEPQRKSLMDWAGALESTPLGNGDALTTQQVMRDDWR